MSYIMAGLSQALHLVLYGLEVIPVHTKKRMILDPRARVLTGWFDNSLYLTVVQNRHGLIAFQRLQDFLGFIP